MAQRLYGLFYRERGARIWVRVDFLPALPKQQAVKRYQTILLNAAGLAPIGRFPLDERYTWNQVEMRLRPVTD